LSLKFRLDINSDYISISPPHYLVMTVGTLMQSVSHAESTHRKTVSGLTIDGAFWRSDLLTLNSVLKRYGSSLYLLIPKELVKKLHLNENQQVNLTMMSQHNGARAGIFIDLGIPVVEMEVQGLQIKIRPKNKVEELFNRLALRYPVIQFMSSPVGEDVAEGFVEFYDTGYLVNYDAKVYVEKEARRLGIKIVEAKCYSNSERWVPLDWSAFKGRLYGGEKIEIKWTL
jgi:hypothetical protein